jgi:hypothetical protein
MEEEAGIGNSITDSVKSGSCRLPNHYITWMGPLVR